MAPDLNSLPPSQYFQQAIHATHNMQSTSYSGRQGSSSPHGSTSLAAAATMNATDRSRRSSSGLQSRGSPQLDRISSDHRRSQVANAISLNDPATPSPGELVSGDHRASIGNSFSAASPPNLGGRGTIATGDPHHQRQPSLGDIHNELEQEQEAQVNRMLQMIRSQQQQLDALHRSNTDHSSGDNRVQEHGPHSSTAIADEPTPGSERSFSFQHPPRSISRNPSSANRSPALRAVPYHDIQHPLVPNNEWIPPPSPLDPIERRNSNRDESAYYQAETANLTRENQMLKVRIRELEKQLAESNKSTVGGIQNTNNVPSSPSNLMTSPVLEG